MGNVVVEWANW